MHSAVQTTDVTIISYKPLSGLNLLGTHNTMAVTCPQAFPLGVYKPCMIILITHTNGMTVSYI